MPRASGGPDHSVPKDVRVEILTRKQLEERLEQAARGVVPHDSGAGTQPVGGREASEFRVPYRQFRGRKSLGNERRGAGLSCVIRGGL